MTQITVGSARKRDGSMTRDEAIHKVVSLAYEQVGYREGADNWNKYADNAMVTEAIGWNVQNQPWCAVFICYLFIESFGLYQGKEMMHGCSAGCAVQAEYYQRNNSFYVNPCKGDQIFFYVGGGINHTGIVVDISGSTITTIEGNYSDSVCTNTYFIGDTNIAGYGRPCWELVSNDEPDDEPEPEPFTEDREYRELHYPMGLMIPQDDIKAWQQILVCWGYNLGKWGVDGEFGVLTMQRTKDLQRRCGLEEDGIVGEKTWTEGIKMPK